jgi:acetyltransferase-like isoleucine patch superfamily enzyme
MASRLLGLLRSLFDVRAWAHLFRMVHFYRYSYVTPLAAADVGDDVRISPTASFRNGERISIGAGTHIGEGCCIWAGDGTGRVDIGDHALFGPNVMVTASNYRTAPGTNVMDQERIERDVVIGRDVWLGTRVVVLPGVEIGDGAVVGAGAVVTADLPAGAIAVGVPARVVGSRQDEHS